MKNSKALFLDLVNQIKLPENRNEIQSIVYILMENIFSLSRTDIHLERTIVLEPEVEERLEDMIRRINAQEPIQYVVGECEFFGRKFTVNPAVLIPRPETEELVRCILSAPEERKGQRSHIMDIGTGSGCIGITLALSLRDARVTATDVSTQALDVARKNAAGLGAHVQFLAHDILREEIPFHNLDVVVSNPPYIAWNEMPAMSRNVVAFEPHLALFVADEDPLLFYKAIAKKAAAALRPGGLLAVEINERFGGPVASMLESAGFEKIAVVKDLFGKERIVKGILS